MKAIYLAKSVEGYKSSSYQREIIASLSKKIELFLYGPGFSNYSPDDTIHDVIAKSGQDPDCLILGHRWLSDCKGQDINLYPHLNLKSIDVPLFAFLNKEYVNLAAKLDFFNDGNFVKVFCHHHKAHEFNKGDSQRFLFTPFGFSDEKIKRQDPERAREIDLFFSGVLRNPRYESSVARSTAQKELFYEISGYPIVKKDRYRSYKIFWNAIPPYQVMGESGPIVARALRHIAPKYAHRFLPEDQYSASLTSSKIVLNSLSPAGLIGPRYFESMAAGAIVLTEQGAQLNDVFSDSDYVGFSVKSGAKEFSDQLDWLLSNDSKRIEMARKTQDKVFAFHTWDARTDSIVRVIKEEIV